MKPNCHYQTLHKAEIGQISRCNSCGNLRVEIGSLLALISAESFELILDDFVQRRVFYAENHTEERVLICLNNNNLYLKLTIREFDEVLELFEIANHMLKVNQLMTID